MIYSETAKMGWPKSSLPFDERVVPPKGEFSLFFHSFLGCSLSSQVLRRPPPPKSTGLPRCNRGSVSCGIFQTSRGWSSGDDTTFPYRTESLNHRSWTHWGAAHRESTERQMEWFHKPSTSQSLYGSYSPRRLWYTAYFSLSYELFKLSSYFIFSSPKS